MTPAALRFWQRVHRKAASLMPDMASAYLAGVEVLRERLAGRELESLIAAGAVDRYIARALSDENVGAAFSRLRAQVQQTASDGVKYFARDIPGVALAERGGIRIAFDVLSPRVVDAVRALDTRVLTRLATDTRETVRAIIENGIRDGANPRATSKAIRELIGLGTTQVQEVENYRAALESGKVGKALRYTARDRRFDASVRAGTLDAAKIDKMVEAYTKRRIAINASNTARTATLDSFKTGQRLAWQDAIDKGIVPPGPLMKRWKGVMDDREREEHIAMEDETVSFDEPYSSGQMYAGEGDYNCRCVDVVFVGRG